MEIAGSFLWVGGGRWCEWRHILGGLLWMNNFWGYVGVDACIWLVGGRWGLMGWSTVLI